MVPLLHSHDRLEFFVLFPVEGNLVVRKIACRFRGSCGAFGHDAVEEFAGRFVSHERGVLEYDEPPGVHESSCSRAVVFEHVLQDLHIQAPSNSKTGYLFWLEIG